MSLEKVLKTTNEERKAIRKSYDRTDEEIEEDIQSLKDWLKKQPHLPQDEDKTRLRMMLLYNKFSLEKTKNKLDMYYSIKHIAPEFCAREPMDPEVSQLMEDIISFPLPHLSPDLDRVFLMRFRDKESQFNMTTFAKMAFAMLDLLIMRDSSLAHCVVIDFQTVRLGHVVQITPVALKKTVTVMEKAYSDRIKGIHFINVPAYANTIVILLNSILSEKLANRVHVHKDLNSLNKVLSAKVLPNEYGGTAGPVDELYSEWKKYFKSQNDWLKELVDKKSDERKRIGKPIDSEMFGMCGSFRKLNYD